MDLNFFLKQVDPILVAKSYLDGSLRLPSTKIKLDSSSLTKDLDYGNSFTSPAYEIIDKNGTKIRVITINHKNWKSGILPTNYLCNWCRLEYNNDPLVLPINIEYCDSSIICYGTGTYCSFECCYADLKTKQYCDFYSRDFIYNNSENLLRFLYGHFHGNNKLIAAPDWTLHVKNGGFLDSKDFFNEQHTYVRIPNIILQTAKTCYSQSNK